MYDESCDSDQSKARFRITFLFTLLYFFLIVMVTLSVSARAQSKETHTTVQQDKFLLRHKVQVPEHGNCGISSSIIIYTSEGSSDALLASVGAMGLTSGATTVFREGSTMISVFRSPKSIVCTAAEPLAEYLDKSSCPIGI